MSRAVKVDELVLINEMAATLGVPAAQVRRASWNGRGFSFSGLLWGEGPSQVVLLHGGSMNAHAWDGVLLQTPLDAFALDLPGHGLSDWFDQPVYLPEDLARVIVPALEALAPAARTVVGHSLGGLTALALAASRPDLVGHLVLVDASPEPRPEESAQLRGMVSASGFESFDDMVAHVLDPARGDSRALRRKLLLSARELPDGRWGWRHDARPGATGDKWTTVFEALPRGWWHAATVRCPTLLLRGERSAVLSEQDVDRYVGLVPDLRVQVIQGAGHHLPGERPREVGQAIAAFVAEGQTSSRGVRTATGRPC